MSQLDHLLLRPQVLVAQHSGAKEDIAALVLDTVGRILRDLNQGRVIMNRLSILAVEALQQLWARLEAGLVQSLQALQSLIAPIMSVIDELSEAISGDTVTGIAEVIGLLVDRLVLLADALKVDALEAQLKTVAHTIDAGLRLSDGGIFPLIRDFVDHITEGMMRNYLDGDLSNPALERFIIGTNLHKIAAHMERFVAEKEFSLDFDYYITLLMNELRNATWDEKLDQFKSFVETAGGGLQAVTNLSGTFSVKFNADPSGPEDPVSWYATWFNNLHVAIPVGVDDRWNVTNESWYADMDFVNHPYEKMEKIAHITYLVADFVEALVNGILIAMRPRGTSIFNTVFQILKGSLTAGMGDSTSQSWVDFYKFAGANVSDHSLSLLGNFFFGLCETNLRICPNCCYMWLNVMNNYGKYSLSANYTYLVRELILTSFTLNNTVSSHTTKKNADRVLGLSNLFADLGSWLGAAFSGRGGYGIHNDVGEMVGWWLLSLLPSMGFGLCALGIRKIKTDVSPPTGVWLGILLQNLIYGLLKFPVYWYIIWDGNTEGGRSFGFLGHGPKATSPYKLPYPSGVELQIIQGNLGPWSHNQLNASLNFEQVYSWDFSHDYHDIILAIRAGTPSFVRESIQDDNKSNDNRVQIRHDRDMVALPEHDRGVNGVPEQTTAQYLHGAKNGVTHAFALYGIPSAFILTNAALGTTAAPVRQGQVVLLAGNTGNSRINHLHLNIRGNSTSNGTSPMVFSDCDESNGVPLANRYYTSSNVLVPYVARPEFAVYPSLKDSGTASSPGSNTIVLDATASPHGDHYKGCHIVVLFGPSATGPFQTEYKRITAYDSGNQTVTVDSDWGITPNGATILFQIGIPYRADASGLERNFASWAIYTDPINATAPYNPAAVANFADGGLPFRYAKLAKYMTAPMTGTVTTGSAAGGNTIVIPAQPAAFPAASFVGRFIVLSSLGNIVEYKRILTYALNPGGATATLTIDGTWDAPVTATFTFQIGNVSFANATPQEKEFSGAFHGLGPSGGPPVDFAGGSKPYQYTSYKGTW